MKISILLPYKENFSPDYPGAVSLFINDTTKESKYKKQIKVYGSTNFKNIYSISYQNIDLKNRFIGSQSKQYINKFIEFERKDPSALIEIHNRPIYLKYLLDRLNQRTYAIFFHNDPLSMEGSKSINDRNFLLKNAYKIIFNSHWSKSRFLEGLDSKFINSEKLKVFYQSAKKGSLNNLKNKKKWITFVGKLNKAKGYDIFGKAIINILNKNKDWSAIIVGDEKREKLDFRHKNINKLGFLNHQKVLSLYTKTSIAVVCSRWEEPFGRTSLEASANGCAVIISNKGGLPETVTNSIVLKNLSRKKLEQAITILIKDIKKRKNLQKLSLKNFYLTHEYVTNLIDKYRDEKLSKINFFNTIKKKNSLRILHVTNFNERLDGRLFFNTGRRINNGFIRLGHSVLGFSDRDIVKYYKSYKDFTGASKLNEKLMLTCYNYKPDLIVLGHCDLINAQQLGQLKSDYPNIKIAQWFLDPLNKNGPDYERNKSRILDKSDYIDANFLTTSPDVLNFLPQKKSNYFIPNPVDSSFETLSNFERSCGVDVFFALSHGVHRGVLKRGKADDRNYFLNELLKKSENVKFDIYGLKNKQPIWADHYFQVISNAKMGLNLSRGKPIKYYSSDRLVQIVGNGLVTLIDEKTKYMDFFSKKEMVFYKNLDDLSEKIIRIAGDDKLRKSIGRAGKKKYFKYFNSTIVADFIINKTLEINDKKKYFWNK
jgi:glycosyltransferase involved in cell wall biosynthesis|tara:strand:- start:3913 stop:6045 length:2133 start_codon:yes stop_codon:yes gene_type:complete